MSFSGYPPGQGSGGYPPGLPNLPGSSSGVGYPPGPGLGGMPQAGAGGGGYPPAPVPAPGYPPGGPGIGMPQAQSGSGGGYPPPPPPGPPQQSGLWMPGGGPAPYPTAGGPAPSHSGGGPAPYPTAGGPAPYPGGTPAPYPTGGSMGVTPTPYPSGPQPQSGPAPYPPTQQQPLPSQSFSGYSSAPAPYPTSKQAPGRPPPPVPSAVTHHKSVTQVTKGVASMSVGNYKDPPTEGTVKAHANFNAEEDANTLRTAMKGFGTDEKAIIRVIAHRSNQQRQEIKIKFKSLYGKDLIRELKSELSGHFEEVVLALFKTHREYDAYILRKSIQRLQGIGTDEDALIEVLCTRTNKEIEEIKKQYKLDYGRNLESDVRSDTSGHFKRLLTSMLTGGREPNGPVDRAKARTEAQELYQAGEARWGTDESKYVNIASINQGASSMLVLRKSKFNYILATRSVTHLRAVFEEYAKICKYDIEESIKREMSGDLKDGMLTVVKCVRDKPGYFAERLYKSMKGLGTDDSTLVRVMVTRCEVDMVQIKKKFHEKYYKTLGSFIKGDTSGDYKRILLALAGEH